MNSGNQHPNTASSTRIDGHKLSEFVYGTIAGMVATSGIGDSSAISWSQAASIIIVGAAAIWLAHTYSLILGHRIVSGQRVTGRDLGHFLAGSWPIVVAGFVLSTPLIGTAASAWPLSTALRYSGYVGLVILALVGFLAGMASKETWPRRLLLAAISTALGVAVIAVELLAHH